MEFFITTLIAVATMLVYAVPGYISVKAKLIKPESISAFAVVLMYVCSPCLTVYSVNAVPVYTKELIIQIVGFFFISMAAQAIMLGLAFLILRKKYDDVKYRVFTVATSFGNCAFMGVPLLQDLFPGNPNVTILSVSYLLGMNIFGWTIGSAIITRDKKYIKPWKAIVNPAAIAMIICLPLFFTTWRLPEKVADIFTRPQLCRNARRRSGKRRQPRSSRHRIQRGYPARNDSYFAGDRRRGVIVLPLRRAFL